jgi:deferrochelatase/peroxidase EfeB
MTCPFATRRGLLGVAAGLAGAAALGAAAPPLTKTEGVAPGRALPFHGPHQNGIATPMQAHTYFAAFDVVTEKREELAALLRTWTDAAAKLTQGQPLGDSTNPDAPPADSGDVAGLPPSRLTLTFGFGPTLFSSNGADRFGLAKHRPAAFVDLPKFVGDQLVPERTGGDLSVQACGDDPQATMSAVRQLMRLAYGVANPRWVQAGFIPGYAPNVTPRNLMGFKDGTRNPGSDSLNTAVWVGDEGPSWMQGGSYLVVRRIRIALEHWDRSETDYQEQVVGRHKLSGAPLGGHGEFDPPDFAANDKDGNPVIPEDAHVRLGAHETNAGAVILRRAYSYNDGANVIAERWPPWRQGMSYDAGLFFLAYQKDPRTGFIRIFERMAKLDAMNQFTTHVASALFAVPPGCAEGGFIGQGLFVAS